MGKITIPVRTGPYQYVATRSGGETETLDVTAGEREAGEAEVEVGEGDIVMEIALSSTSNPDLDPARGQLWPPEHA